jgi:D-serine deaminase-like pyridoxal phosphate-dependent protein
MISLDRIDQPALLLNTEIARRNIDRMVSKASQNGVEFRPHFKTHQSAEIGEWFREQGVNKITVASVEMAEYFAQYGWKDITIAFSLNIRQLPRIQALVQKISLSVLVENEEAVNRLTSLKDCTLGIWIKVDVGNFRTGLDWAQPGPIIELCTRVNQIPNLRLKGFLTHSGHTYKVNTREEVCSIFHQGIDRLNLLRQKVEAAGIKNLLVSVGDTPGCTLCEVWSGADEVRPGNFVFYDAQQFVAGVCKFEDIAVVVACPVVALHEERREVVIYGGAIHLSKDFVTTSGEKSFGLAALQDGDRWGKPINGAIVKSLSQEHGIVRIPGIEFEQVKIGDLLFILPAHSCLTVQVMRKYLTLDGKTINTLN